MQKSWTICPDLLCEGIRVLGIDCQAATNLQNDLEVHRMLCPALKLTDFSNSNRRLKLDVLPEARKPLASGEINRQSSLPAV